MFFTCTDGLASGACNNVTVQRVANVQTCPKPSAGSQNSVVWVATLLQDSLRFTTAIDQKEAALKRWWREVPCGINPTSEPSPHILLRKLGAKFYGPGMSRPRGTAVGDHIGATSLALQHLQQFKCQHRFASLGTCTDCTVVCDHICPLRLLPRLRTWLSLAPGQNGACGKGWKTNCTPLVHTPAFSGTQAHIF